MLNPWGQKTANHTVLPLHHTCPEPESGLWKCPSGGFRGRRGDEVHYDWPWVSVPLGPWELCGVVDYRADEFLCPVAAESSENKPGNKLAQLTTYLNPIKRTNQSQETRGRSESQATGMVGNNSPNQELLPSSLRELLGNLVLTWSSVMVLLTKLVAGLAGPETNNTVETRPSQNHNLTTISVSSFPIQSYRYDFMV